MPRFSRLILGLAVLATSLFGISRLEGPFTISLVVPHGLNIHLDYADSPVSAVYLSYPPNVTYKVDPNHPPRKPKVDLLPLREPEKSIHEAITSFSGYGATASRILARKYSRFLSIPVEQHPLVDALGYANHFASAERSVTANAYFAEKIAEYAKEIYSGMPSPSFSNDEVDYELVALAWGHLVRDWSEQGAPERAQIFGPILETLGREFIGSDVEKKVLVPGFGLGRLAHEIANRKGYAVDACELDYGSILTYHYLLNRTSSLNEHVVYPFVTSWTHQATPDARFQPIRIPDMLPSHNVKLIEGDFLKEFPESAVYDAVVTLFFIDVGENIIDFLQNIHRLLKPGGIWINLGPFKWGSFAQIQLSAEEVLGLADLIGFDVDHASRQSIDSVYAHQPQSLLKFTYVTQFWAARKRTSL